MDIDEPPVPLPSAKSITIAPRITLQPPLSRRGHGPGLIIVTSKEYNAIEIFEHLDPAPLQKWAEEGYAVVQVVFSEAEFVNDVTESVKALMALPEYDHGACLGLISASPFAFFALGLPMLFQFTRAPNRRW
jgi:carboxymethylenebutenolidase